MAERAGRAAVGGRRATGGWLLVPAVLAVATAVAGCGALRRRAGAEKLPAVEVLAVMPVEPAAPAGSAVGEPEPRLTADAARILTAQLYGVLSARPRWRLVPDLAVAEALRGIDASQPLEVRARALGQATGADAVLYGTVSRFVERVGTDVGVERPASVSFALKVVLTGSGAIVWQRSFDRTQRPLALNLFQWWMFWRAGPRWLRAQELARLGVEELVEDLEDHFGG